MNTDDSRVQVTQEIPCTSWGDFKARVHRDYAEEIIGVSPLFRGHARSDWKLASPWERKLSKWGSDGRGSTRNERAYLLDKILGDFKELSVGLPGIKSRELDDLDWWAVGRHFGLITPLLDWTRSPYVAAFFAFTGFAEELNPGVTTSGNIDARNFLSISSTESVAIWALMVDDSLDNAKKLKVLNPRVDIGQRQRAQRGLFTQLDDNQHFDIESYLSHLPARPSPEPYTPVLRKYLIPGREVSKVITELRMMNITFATLFPDLEGAALQANFESVAFTLMAFSLVRSDASISPTDSESNRTLP